MAVPQFNCPQKSPNVLEYVAYFLPMKKSQSPILAYLKITIGKDYTVGTAAKPLLK